MCNKDCKSHFCAHTTRNANSEYDRELCTLQKLVDKSSNFQEIIFQHLKKSFSEKLKNFKILQKSPGITPETFDPEWSRYLRLSALHLCAICENTPNSEYSCKHTKCITQKIEIFENKSVTFFKKNMLFPYTYEVAKNVTAMLKARKVHLAAVMYLSI